MAPKKNSPKKNKKQRKVLSLAEKLKILNFLRDGEKIAVVARRLNLNESTVRTIRDNEEKIRRSASIIGRQAQFTKVVRNNHVEKTEEMLIIWIQDLMHKNIPLSTASIRNQALTFHSYLNEKYEKDEKFNASKGWFEKFKGRFLLHNVKFSGNVTLHA